MRLKPNLGIIACTSMCLFGFALAANAQQNCAPRQQVEHRLNEKYGEVVHMNGLSQMQVDGNVSVVVIEIWANEETGTWTSTSTAPNGLTCILGAGSDFFKPEPTEIPKGEEM